MAQRVFRCPVCGANLLLWTGVCIRCGRVDVDEAILRRVTPATIKPRQEPSVAEAEDAPPGSPPPDADVAEKGEEAEPRKKTARRTTQERGKNDTAAREPGPAPGTSENIALPRTTAASPATRSLARSAPEPEKISIEEMFGDGSPLESPLSGLAETNRFTDIVPDAAVYTQTAANAEAAASDKDDGGAPTTFLDTATLSRELAKDAPPAPEKPRGSSPVPPPPPGMKHFLVLGFKDAIELTPGKRTAIGRHPSASVRIDQPQISRKHAEIDWQGEPPRCVLRDAGRDNTFLNGDPVPRNPQVPLKDGDEIYLGRSFKMVYRLTRSASELFAPASQRLRPPEAAKAGDASEERRVATVVPREAEIPLEGDFVGTPPLMVLESIFRRELTGILMISTGTGTGTMDVERGRAKNVVFGTASGRDAVDQITRLKEGAYRFLKS